MKILVIEDEPDMRDNMVKSLEQEMYIVETAIDYSSAIEKLDVYEYDCILLDIGLPDESGLSILKELKNNETSAGIIIVSAKDSLDDKVLGLNLGADDYLPKPFHMAELHARIRSVIRRKTLGGNNTVAFNNLLIDTDQRSVFIDGKAVDMNSTNLIYCCTSLLTKTDW